MTTVLDPLRSPLPSPEVTPPAAAPGEGARRLGEFALAAIGMGTAVFVIDGSRSWGVIRLVAVGAVFVTAVQLLARSSRRRAGWILALFGVLGTAVAGAMTLSYARAGWSPRTFAGALTLAGGATALALGVTFIVQSMRGLWRLLVIPIVLALGYLVVFPVGIATYATNVGRPRLGSETPADRSVPFVDATFSTSDGVRLSGWYIPSQNGGAVVLLHGASSTRAAVLAQAIVLARHGYGVLLYDARGMGASGGRAMNFGWYGDRDVAAAIGYLEHRTDVDARRIGAVGESMGGEEAIGAMAADPRLRAVVAEGATNRVAGDFNWLPGRYGLRGRIHLGVQRVTYALTDFLTAARPPISLRNAVASAQRPVLLITAGNVTDEADAGRYIQTGAPSWVTAWNVPGSAHTGGLRTQPNQWESRVTAFLDQTLTRPTP